MKELGIIGGLGPMATACFMEMLTKMTDASSDQEHIRMVIVSDPTIPDRTDYILGKSDANPLKKMIKAGKRLERMSVDFIAVPCMTAHCFHSQLDDAIRLPIINGISQTARYLRHCGVSSVGLMATKGTVASGIFRTELEKQGIACIHPDSNGQDIITEIIFDGIKADKEINMQKFHKCKEDLRKAGSECIILGCTELSVLKNNYDIGSGFLDAMEVLAQRCIINCGARVKEEYNSLIS